MFAQSAVDSTAATAYLDFTTLFAGTKLNLTAVKLQKFPIVKQSHENKRHE